MEHLEPVVEMKLIVDDLKARGEATRDNWKIKELNYWLEKYETILKISNKSEGAGARYEARPKEGLEKECAISDYRRQAITAWAYPICVRYTGGCEIDDIKNDCLTPAILNGPFYKAEVNRYRDELPDDYLFEIQRFSNEVYEAYCFLSWCVCLDADPDSIADLSTVIAKPGTDRLVDIILQRYDAEREVATELKLPKVFGQLSKVIDASQADQIKLIERHLEKWASIISKLKGTGGLGGTSGLQGAKNNEDLATNAFIKRNYMGWWAWEVALLVRVFGIDDTSFADHPLYPKDLARYRDPDNPVNVWPIGAENSTGMEVDLEEDEDVLKTLSPLTSAVAGTPTASLEQGHALMAFEDDDDANAGYLYLAVDKASAKYFGDLALIIPGSSDMQISASVSTSEHAINFEKKAISCISDILKGHYDRYSFFTEAVEDGNIANLLSVITEDPVQGVLLPIASGDNWSAWIDAGQLSKNGPIQMSVKYARIKDGELLTVAADIKDRADMEVGKVVQEIQRLVALYAGHEMIPT